jgi:phosphotransferase system enzyme I (PtsP)
MAAPGGFGGGARQLLRRVRDVMAGPGTAQERLDSLVRIIAANFVAEVCSIYVMRAGRLLELFATVGLRAEAVHRTRLQVGQGLVGEIAATARAFALADAQSHPQFAYLPETGEELFHSLMGVPILRGGRVAGVLVVQNRTAREYDDEDVETLQTIAMVLAELVASGELISPEEQQAAAGGPTPLRLTGLALNGGLALGRAVLHSTGVTITRVVADDPKSEEERLKAALAGLHSAIDGMLTTLESAPLGAPVDILETYRMFAQDRGWLGRINDAVRGGLTAEAAVQKVMNDTRARMASVSDPYLRERLLDLEDLNNRLLQHLTGADSGAGRELPDDAVLVARSLGPAELLEYDWRRLRAVVLEHGSATAHVAIVARALDLPMIGRVSDATHQVEPGDEVLVDGGNAQLFVRPGDDARQAFVNSIQVQQEQRAALQALRPLPAVTRDGVPISLNLNAGLLLDLAHLHDSGADGVGLYRTEVPFMVQGRLPDLAAQIELYRRTLEQAEGKPVTFRTLDIGGDKLLPDIDHGDHENPAMGWRAIRVALDRPSLLRQQLRALLRAAAGHELRVMFPMVAEVAEYVSARRILDMELERERAKGGEGPAQLRVGVMLEVPALVWQLPSLLPRIDFLSVGSNDLLQFLFASDRNNPLLAGRYDALAPSVLALLRKIAADCRSAGVEVAVCGEIAGQPLEAMTLIGLGYRNLSMASASIGAVKRMVRSLDVAPLEEYLGGLGTRPEHSLRSALRAFAKDHEVAV